jgi:hydrogenase maturation protease
MNLAHIEPVVNAVLYEGYILYPYRASSVKNRQRWTFGGVYPRAYTALDPSSPCQMQTECLLRADGNATIDVHVRFLHLVKREIGALPVPAMELPPDTDLIKVPSLSVGDQRFYAWEEAVERDVAAPALAITRLAREALRIPFAFAGTLEHEPLREQGGAVVGQFIRTSASLEGLLTIAANEVAPQVFRLRVEVENLTPFLAGAPDPREEAQLRAFASTHTVVGIDGGAFISLIDPPEDLKEASQACRNQGTWPVLVGEVGAADMMLSSPVILYDYPQVAPESPGDLFDATEIDEILTLRILGMTDEEKREMAAVDERARALLARTEGLTAADMERLHGTLRDPRFASPAPAHAKPELAFLRSAGRDLRIGDRVRLRPKPGADIMDVVLKDELAIIEAIERDFEDRVHVAVVLEADPGREFGLERMPGHRFFFAPDEIEPVEEERCP